MQLNLVAHFEKTGIGKMSFCKKQRKKSAAFATDLFGRGRRTLSPRSTLVGQDGSTVPKGTVFTAVLFSSFCKKRIKKIGCFRNRPFWQGQKGLFLLARRSSVRTALPCQRARYSLPSYSRPSARSEKKSAAFATDLFGRPTLSESEHFTETEEWLFFFRL